MGKAYVSSFVYCDSIQQQVTPQGIQNQIVSPLQMLAPISVPGNYSFAIACSIMGYDKDKSNRLVLEFVDPKDNVSTLADVTIQPVGIQTPTGKSVPAIQFNLDIRNFVLRYEGLHKTRVKLNDEVLAEYMITVVSGEQNG